MQPEIKSLLYDMQQACHLILQFTDGKDFSHYAEDIACKSAVERQFITLGEALNRVYKIDPAIGDQVPAHRDIINFRNILVHGYDCVEDEVVWGIIRKYLPELYQSVNRLMSDDPNS